jgi:NADH-quinone oxidoreductase subunit G
VSDDTISIEVDGKTVEARKGQMLIEVTDSVGAYIPRFCYHEKLSVAANCRMCLVEVEKAPKPLPACATPVADGMKVFTKSAYAIAAQKATMEFLLINHPLDCPICDQGGECELQDLAMGYGRDVSRYNDRKRVVKDQDLGPLVSTDMTRCIHCTRCVRFGAEIAGIPELGTIGRSENMRISTFIEKSIDHELSANIIDLCPVGALNNKPYRYSARAWEMVQQATISPHDCVGSNMYAHVLRGRIKRIVPNRNEALNETWLPDRDRFSYEGVYSSDRLLKPRIKENDQWRDIDWQDALQKLAESLGDADPDKISMLVSPSATVEENHLLVRIAEQLETSNIDHRVRRQDFAGQDSDPLFPWIGTDIADLERADALLIAGSNVRKEVPIIAHRVRKAALSGAKVCFANSESYDYKFDVAAYASDAGLVELLAGIAVAASGSSTLPAALTSLCSDVVATTEQKEIAAILAASNSGRVIIGTIAARHPAASAVKALAAAIADLTGATFGALSEGANSAGAHLAGVLPHRGRGGRARGRPGHTAADILSHSSDAVLLFGLEPDEDLPGGDNAVEHLSKQKFVAAFTPYKTYALETCADLLLPIGTFAETSGTFVNCEGRWQSFAGVAHPVGEARPGWKVLRVLANLLRVPDSDYQTSSDVRDELQALLGDVKPDNSARQETIITKPNGADAPENCIDVPMYQVDSVVRRAVALQLTPEARRSRGEVV